MLDPYACLLGTTVTGLWRLAAVSDDGTIPLPGELVLETDRGFVSLSYTQDGLSCTGPVERDDVRWATESWLAMGRHPDAEEWLDLVEVEDGPALPLFVTAFTGWFADGPYQTPVGLTLFPDGDTFALILSGDGDPVVLMTTEQFDLVCTDHATARARAERTAAAMRVRLIERELRL
ncbi:MAG: hypothetical protein M3422_05100 [Actinomycetota bacterium]|nr:hypothetical protein [Actinomycetota bacterium]